MPITPWRWRCGIAKSPEIRGFIAVRENCAVLDGARVPKMMVEVRGVEPLSETALAKLLRVYCAIDLGHGTPTHGLIRIHPLGSAPLSGRTEPP